MGVAACLVLPRLPHVAVRPLGERGIAVDVVDHVGFLPDAVPHLPYGLRLSIARRMRRVGGSARVGSGTTVELCWPAAGADG